MKQTLLEDMVYNAPSRVGANASEGAREVQDRAAFIHFLRGMLHMDPKKRWTPAQVGAQTRVQELGFGCGGGGVGGGGGVRDEGLEWFGGFEGLDFWGLLGVFDFLVGLMKFRGLEMFLFVLWSYFGVFRGLGFGVGVGLGFGVWGLGFRDTSFFWVRNLEKKKTRRTTNKDFFFFFFFLVI